MKAEWTPDDSIFGRDETGEVKGVAMVRKALKDARVRIGKGVVTSQDPGMQAARDALKRDIGLEGVEQWILPIVICPTSDTQMVWLYSELQPGTSVPSHSHANDHFRIVIGGSFETGGVRLGPGDWMSVPAGVAYDMQVVGDQVCKLMYPHPGPRCPNLTD